MAYIKSQPYLIQTFDTSRILDQFERDFQNFFNKTDWFEIEKKSSYPKMNMFVNPEEGITIEASVVGLTKDDVKLVYEDNTLTISGESPKSEKFDESKITYQLREIPKGTFRRSIMIDSKYFDVSKIKGNVENGLLKITIPILEHIAETKKQKVIQLS